MHIMACCNYYGDYWIEFVPWVSPRSGLRYEVGRCYTAEGLQNPMAITKHLMKSIEALQTADLGDDGDAVRAKRYRAEILPHFPPIFHKV